MNRRGFFCCLLVLPFLSIFGCPELVNGYLRCNKCGAVYKSVGGFGGHHRTPCRNCGGKLHWVGKEESGWDEGRFKKNGDEIE